MLATSYLCIMGKLLANINTMETWLLVARQTICPCSMGGSRWEGRSCRLPPGGTSCCRPANSNCLLLIFWSFFLQTFDSFWYLEDLCIYHRHLCEDSIYLYFLPDPPYLCKYGNTVYFKCILEATHWVWWQTKCNCRVAIYMAAETELVAIKIESCKGATPIDSTSADRLSNQKRRCLNKNKSQINC